MPRWQSAISAAMPTIPFKKMEKNDEISEDDLKDARGSPESSGTAAGWSLPLPEGADDAARARPCSRPKLMSSSTRVAPKCFSI